MMRRLGFHISIAGGLDQVVPRALVRGCTAFQMFTSSPTRWKRKPIDRAAADAFRKAVAAAEISPVFVHAIYLLNLASGDVALRRKSVENLAEEISRAEMLGAAGVVFHLGSVGGPVRPSRQYGRPGPATDLLGEGGRRVARSLEDIRRLSNSRLPLILENSAGAGSLVGGTLAEVGAIIALAPGAEPLLTCFDTAHAFGAGIAVHTRAGLEATFGHPLLRERLALVHANDSTGEFGSHRDRHWHVGKGKIGAEAFGRIVRHPLLADVPLVMETPGTEADDKRNMRTMKKLLLEDIRWTRGFSRR